MKKIAFFICFMGIIGQIVASKKETITAIKNGRWNDASIWDVLIIPGSDVYIVIPEGVKVIVDANLDLSKTKECTVDIFGELYLKSGKIIKIPYSNFFQFGSEGKIASHCKKDKKSLILINEFKWWDFYENQILTSFNRDQITSTSVNQFLYDRDTIYYDWSKNQKQGEQYYEILSSSNGINWNLIGRHKNTEDINNIHHFYGKSTLTDKGRTNFVKIYAIDSDGKISDVYIKKIVKDKLKRENLKFIPKTVLLGGIMYFLINIYNHTLNQK